MPPHELADDHVRAAPASKKKKRLSADLGGERPREASRSLAVHRV